MSPTLASVVSRAALCTVASIALALSSQASPLLTQGGPGGPTGPSRSAQRDPGGHLPAKRLPLPPDDPTTDQEWGCWYWGYYAWNWGAGNGTVEGRVYWPNDCDGTQQPPAGRHPLVLILHGDGHSFQDYHSLGAHLALNGFIVASISNFGSNGERAQDALDFLAFLYSAWSMQSSLSTEIALMGHSRGGEAVLTLARLIHQDPGLPYDVQSVFSLAPTDNDEGGFGLHEDLDGDESRNYFVLYGTHDEDVYGYCVNGTAPDCGAVLTGPRGNGFTLYDRAGSEFGTEPFPLSSDVVTKSMMFVKGANHNSWRDITCGAFPPPGQLSCNTHKDLLKGYANAYFRWTLMDQTIYRYYFTGDFVLQSQPLVEIQHQFQEGYGRRVLDNFENGAFGLNTLGGTVFAETTVNITPEGPSYDDEPTVPHDTDSLIFRWQPPGLAPWIRWDIPDEQTFFGRRYRDVTDYDFLSFRAGQVYGSNLNTPGEDKDFYVSLYDSSGGQSSWVRVSHHAELPYPSEANLIVLSTFQAQTVSSAMSTVRLPLCAFEGVDLENVTAVRFWFTVTGSARGELVMDNLEFTD